MLRDINRLIKYIRSDSDGKVFRNRIVILILVITSALLFNRFVLSSYVSDDLKISLNRSKLVFQNGKSPYDEEIQNYIKGLARDEKWMVADNTFEYDLPLFQAFVYFPFALIPDYLWASSVFITVNQICIFLAIHMLFILLGWEPKIIDRVFVYVLLIGVFFLQKNILAGNASVIQLTLIIAVIFNEERKNHIVAGIFLGLSFIDPISMLLTLIVLLIILISKREFSIILWSIITIGLLTIFTIIFNQNWIIGWLKSIFLTPFRFPVVNYVIGFEEKFGISLQRLVIIFPILLTSWLVFEIIRMPKGTPEEKIWLLSISGLLNYYVMVQASIYASVLFFLSLILVINVWWNKIQGIGKLILYLFLIGISAGVVLLEIITTAALSARWITLLLISTTFLLMVNLYWSRLWIIRPYLISNSME